MDFDSEDVKLELKNKFKILYPGSQEFKLKKFIKFDPEKGGWESQIYFVDIEFIENEPNLLIPNELNLVIRILMGENTDNRAKDEFKTLQILKDSKILVPIVYFWGKSGSIFVNAYYVMERIEGKLLEEILFDKNISSIKQQAYFYEFVKLQAAIHNFDWKVMDLKLKYKNDEFSYVETKLQNFETYIQKMHYNELNDLMNWLKNNSKKGKLQKFSLIHNDFHPQNIIVNSNEEFFIIDWSGVEIGDYRYDIGWTLMLMTTYFGNTELRDQYIQIYEKISGKIIYIEFWETLACLRRIVDILDFTNPRISANIRDGVKEALLGEMKYFIVNLLERLTSLTDLNFSQIKSKLNI